MSEKKESPPSAAPLRAADFFVDSLPGLLPSKMEQLSMHSGMIMVNETIQGQLFFWLVEAQIPQPQRKLLIWFNGGPGCSSLDGLFLENGPLRLRPPSASEKSTVDNFIDLNPHSWHHASSILYVDQPVGTGYSPVLSYRWNTDLRSVVDQFVVFLDKFLDTFPHLKKAEIYLGGESFGGVYVPYFSSALIFRNEDPKTDKNRVYNVAGGIIESGWMDPLRQYSSYIDYSVKNKLLGSPQLSYAQSNLDKCAVSLRHEGTERIRTQVCERIMDIILDYSKTDGKQCVNMYDIRLRDSDQREGCGLNTWPPGVRSLRDYLSREDVQRALHAEAPTHSARQNIGWEECNQVVFDSLMLDKSLPSYTLLPFLLERIPIVLYGGEKGLVCNTLGIDWMISNMTWNKAKGMQDATLMNWVVNGSSVGTYQTARNLTNIVTYDASHSPNVDQPLYTLDIFNRLLGVKDPVTNFSGILLEPFGPKKGSQPDGNALPIKSDGTITGPASNTNIITPTTIVLFLLLLAGALLFLFVKTSGFQRWDGIRRFFYKLFQCGRKRRGNASGVVGEPVNTAFRRGSGFSEFEDGGQWHELSNVDDEEEEDGDGVLDSPQRNGRIRKSTGRL